MIEPGKLPGCSTPRYVGGLIGGHRLKVKKIMLYFAGSTVILRAKPEESSDISRFAGSFALRAQDDKPSNLLRQKFREVCDDEIGAGAFDRCDRLKGRAFHVDPASLGGGH